MARNNAIAETIIKINPAGIFVEEISADGGKSFKEITLEDMQSIFERTTITTPKLPFSTFYYNRTGGTKWAIACVVPPQRKRINVANRYGDGDFSIDTLIPYTLFGFVIENNIITNSYCCCTKYNPVPDGDKGVFATPLTAEVERQRSRTNNPNIFVFPYGNTFDDTRICWGNLQLPNINEPSDIPNVINMFFDGFCNGDLFHVNTDLGFIDFMRSCDGMTEFDNNMLVQHGNQTVNEFLNRLAR